MPRFSIVVVHFDGVIDDATLHRGLGSLEAQTFADFEVLLYHDGPTRRRLDPAELQARYPHVARVTKTMVRHNDWGHSLRDIGIRAAAGEYIVHFNADNLLYPFALEEIDRELRRFRGVYFTKARDAVFDANDIVVFPILMRGMHTDGRIIWRDPKVSGDGAMPALVSTGYPARLHNIDCMQLVMRRTTWLAEGGWSDRTANADGNLYGPLVDRYGARFVSRILGEHW
ncbi:glycosyl transferase family 2 [Stella humosa]|uniref:Glycosyl transferase family 2 n=1 Tax=Stella humosa TaxID=94 RepID=A0A3N1LE34_9PROT|nr:glycosyltransferase family A protein [Stella humosa]ROP91361.1 glycosyl transferase family 2 [Stella humosa]BBK34279.1 hypothetical protein STHU_49130 [Stella humosa]